MLNKKIDSYLKENYYPFHMPGSKRSNFLRSDLPYGRDFTEIEGFDNLNDPSDIFVEMENEIADLYGVNDAIISTNGSTCGILASIRSLHSENKNILIQRSCHKAVYNAIEVFDLKSDYINVLTNEIGAIVGIDYDTLYNKISTKNYGSLVITSPSYEGYDLDLEKIYGICKEFDTKLILDMAHGSHYILFDRYKKYFDVAITSFHKNLSALTPSAAILINDENLTADIRRNMAIFQTSSPSYVLLQSIDDMISNFNLFEELTSDLRKNLNSIYDLKLKNLQIMDKSIKDRSKILISTSCANISGDELAKLLRAEKIESEMAYPSYCLLIATIFDSNHGFKMLKEALLKIDKKLTSSKKDFEFFYNIPKKQLEIADAMRITSRSNLLEDSVGKIAGQFVYAYPPGIPLVIPGETIDDKTIKNMKHMQANDIKLNIDKYISIID